MSRSFPGRTCAAILGALAVAAVGPLPARAAGTVEPVKKLGSVDFADLAAHPPRVPSRPSLRNSPAQLAFAQLEERRHAEGEGLAQPRAGLSVPSAAPLPVTVGEVQRGFQGEDIQDTVFTNGFELEPPDQGLCGGTFRGKTYLFESVNLSIGLYDTQTNKLTPSVDLNRFFGLAPAFDFDTGKSGPFLSDPRCYYDPDTRRWFHTILEAGVDPDSGALDGTANTLIAVSEGGDPFGPYNVYAIDATLPGCVVCIGDQPLLGADRYGFYVSTAEYDLATGAFFGPQLYALDKRALAAGADVDAVHLQPGTTKTGTVQPATSPNAVYDLRQSGTEWFMAAFDCEPPDCSVDPDSLENTIQVFGLTHTATLRTGTPKVKLLTKVIPSQVYGSPVPQEQPDGFHPLGESLGEPVPEVEGNDARMNQVVYAAGRLWGGVNTIADPGPRDALAWFQVVPTPEADRILAVIKRQGYVAGDANTFLSFPAIGVNDAGRGVIAYSLMGSGHYPSAARTTIALSGLAGGIQIAKLGEEPEDGFTCYPVDEARCRWGDYSASFALPTGEVWSATEWIDDKRTEFANWSTFVWPVNP